jgi:hypothetical protein
MANMNLSIRNERTYTFLYAPFPRGSSNYIKINDINDYLLRKIKKIT